MSSAVIQPLSPDLILPWTPDPEQEALFKRWLKRTAIALFLLFVVIPWLPVFEPEYVPPEKEVVKTKVVLEDVIPVKKKPKPQSKKKPKEVNKPQQIVNKKEQGKGSQSKPNKTSNQLQGVADLNSQLSALRGSLNVAGMRTKKVTSNNKGLVATADRNLLGENRDANPSIGLEVDDNLMKSATVQLSSRQTSQIQSGVGDGGVGSSGSSAIGNYVSGRRDDESIRRTMDKNKGVLNQLYQRKLHDSPDVHGNFVFEMMIEPDGSISKVSLVSSELGLNKLESDLLSRIAKINFGVADVKSTLVVYTYRFFPS